MDKLTETTIAALAYDRDRWKQRAESLEVENARHRAEQDNPNPLTLGELRERDGEPVWNERRKEWGIVDYYDNSIWHTNGHCGILADDGNTRAYFYNRPPKEEIPR